VPIALSRAVVLELRDVMQDYGEGPVLADATLKLPLGDLVLLKGGSGAGKTTLLRVLGLIEIPTKGQVLVDAKDVASMSDSQRARLRRERIGQVFQTHNMIEDLSILDNVLVPMRLARREDRRRALALLDSVGILSKARRKPAELSVGERQRASFARALANDPQYLLADEPTASLDSIRAEEIVGILLGLWERGKTVVIASHDARVWKRLGKARNFELVEGRLVAT
jgi:putative ABC transport system ATP-binding protein